MSSEYLLDTNTAIYLLREHPLVSERERRHGLGYLPFVTAVELLYGAKRSARRQHNLPRYEQFLSRFVILYPNRLTLDVHSDLRLALQKLGRPIPDNDLWQAAITIQHDAILVTSDAHFTVVPGLRTENWTTG